jgi:thiol-disulfide isomerase/thioredoxin
MTRALFAIVALLLLWIPAVIAAPGNLSLYDAPKPVPPITFTDGDGRQQTLADFKGKLLLLNVWATWCLPCRKEMPTLDRLQQTLGGPDFEVVALSIDRGGPDAIRKFFTEIGVQHLAIRVDPTSKAAGDLGAVGLPTTLLIDRQGQELGRLIGPAEWDQPEMIVFLKGLISQSHNTGTTP